MGTVRVLRNSAGGAAREDALSLAEIGAETHGGWADREVGTLPEAETGPVLPARRKAARKDERGYSHGGIGRNR